MRRIVSKIKRIFSYPKAPLFTLWFCYFEEADAVASVGTSEVLVIIKVNITLKPGVSEFLTSAIEPLIATKMPPCEKLISTEF